MNTLEAIYTRRSIRKFTDKPVTDEEIQTLLKAAMFAPSARNAQTWELLVVKSKENRDFIAEHHPYAHMIREASLGIIVCGNVERETAPGYWVQDCSAATQNILLAAHELGLGAVWCGVHPREERIEPLRTHFNIPANITPLNVIVIGNTNEESKTVERFDVKKIHNETF